MKKKINIARQVYKKHGVIVMFLYIHKCLTQKFHGGMYKYRRVYFYILTASNLIENNCEEAQRLTYRLATRDDLVLLKEASRYDIHDLDIEALTNGDRCLLQLDGDELVGYSWLAKSSLVKIEWGFHFNMHEDTVYNYKSYTAPEYRGKGFQSLRQLQLLELIKGENKKQLLSYVDQMNLSSQKGFKKSGYTKIGVLKCIRNENFVNYSLKVPSKYWSTQMRNS